MDKNTFANIILMILGTILCLMIITTVIVLYGFYRDVKDYPCIEYRIEKGTFICDERLDLSKK